jgi:hypothetical protein
MGRSANCAALVERKLSVYDDLTVGELGRRFVTQTAGLGVERQEGVFISKSHQLPLAPPPEERPPPKSLPPEELLPPNEFPPQSLSLLDRVSCGMTTVS